MTRHRMCDHPNKRPPAPRALGAGLALAMALLGCGGAEKMPGSGPPGSGPPPAAGLNAFRSGFYAFASPSTSCGMCHASVQVPFFASPDVQAAYTASKALVDFAHPTNSLFIVYAGNNHCGVATMCGPNSGSPAIVQRDVVQWAYAETSPGSDAGTPPATLAYLTASMAIPPIATLPKLTAGKTAVLRFALSNLKPGVASLAQAILELEIVAPNPTEYRFTNPKIGGSTAVVQLTGLHVLVKPSAVAGPGSEDANQGGTWDALSASIPVSTLPNPLPTTPLSMTPLDTRAIGVGAYSSTGDLNDTITVGFDALK
jgi:hypothetical protein